MIYPLKFLLFILCFCLIYVEAAGKMPGEDEPKKELRSRKPLVPKSLFSVPLPCVDLKERDEKQRRSFNAEISCLRGLLTTPGKHVVVFDCHGCLTNKKMPESTEGPYQQIVSLYQEFLALGAEVVISSAWSEMPVVIRSLQMAGIEYAEEILTETILGEHTKSQYTIVHAGNVVSARQEPHFEKIFADKLEAALWYMRKKGITAVTSITLLDDQDVNIRCFIKKPGEIFGVHYPEPQGILVPSYAVLNPEWS